MQKFKLLNNIFGWVSFVFAAIVYAMTMESSGSFWDCGEFVSGCFKLQVVHPPGAPFFLMLGRLFTLFSGADPLQYGGAENVALTVNLMSALATAGAVLFTFWTTTAFARKFLVKDGEYTDGKTFAIIGAGLIAAGACTFLDSLWFSAVEGEVYALSQFFMSFVVWAIMKWDADDSPYADHWLVLIAYMTGLSIGVHLLSLLALPALAVVYYYKRYKNPTVLGWIAAVAVGFVILGVYMKFIISYTQTFLSGFDKLFVNSFGLPFNSGAFFFIVLLIALLAGGIFYTHKANKRGLNIIFLCFAFSYIGYMSYIMVPVRAIANPPINMNRPTDPFSLKSYVDREQYGDRPLLFGPDYTATGDDIEDYVKTGERWVKNEATGKYEFGGIKQDYKFRKEAQMFFPRMGFWQEEGKKAGFRAWLNPEYNVINRQSREVVKTFAPNEMEQAQQYAAGLNKDGSNLYAVKDKISFKDNMRFFFKYQVGYMYFRYFMWNFAGKQNDIQGTYGNDDGRWITGIPFIDNSGLFFTPEWPQENLSKEMLDNKARNHFYLLPFIIGMIGLIYTLMKDDKTFLVLLVLFGTTGLLQIVYQNEPPIEPRERDYAIAGSFVMYTMWMGFGLIAIFDWLRKKMAEVPSAAIAFALCLGAPVLMGMQGWDDHTRHHRYTARDFAICYLESCAPNAVIFTQGDNDTYPLWYAQEVEGVRPDIRIINLSLLGVDWYIEQLRYKTNEAAPLKMSFTTQQLQGSNRDVTRYKADPRVPQGAAMDLNRILKFIASEKPNDKLVSPGGGEPENYLPVRKFFLDIDTNKARAMNMISKDEDSLLVPRMEWSINNSALLKNDLMTLDIVANNIMERPIYFAVSVAPDAYLGLENYFQLEGLTYRVVPKANPGKSPYTAPVRKDAMYTNMMTKFKFGGIAENPNIYLDENVLRMTVNIRGNFGKLGEALVNSGDKAKAAEVIDYSLKVLPSDRVPHSVFDLSYPKVYYAAGQTEKGHKLLLEMFAKAKDELNYYKTVYKYSLERARDNGDYQYLAQLQQGAFMERREIREQLYVMQEMNMAARQFDTPEFAAQIEKEFNDYRMAFVQVPPGQQMPPQ